MGWMPMWYECHQILSIWMPRTMVKEMNETDDVLWSGGIKMKCDQWGW